VSETDGDRSRPVNEPGERSPAPEPKDLPASPPDGPAAREPDGADSALAELAGRLAKVEGQLAEFHRRAAHREAVIDRLHEENQQLRGGLGRIILEPLVADLIRLYDQLSRESRRLESNGQDGQLMGSFADDVAQILDRCGIEIFSAEPGDPFEPDRHKPLAVVACDDEARHNTVAEVLAAGFAERDSGRIRRPVQARFHRYMPAGDGAGHSRDAAQSQ
jgi:molecular chaperone GrpE